jgi:hypothetical protein
MDDPGRQLPLERMVAATRKLLLAKSKRADPLSVAHEAAAAPLM